MSLSNHFTTLQTELSHLKTGSTTPGCSKNQTRRDLVTLRGTVRRDLTGALIPLNPRTHITAERTRARQRTNKAGCSKTPCVPVPEMTKYRLGPKYRKGSCLEGKMAGCSRSQVLDPFRPVLHIRITWGNFFNPETQSSPTTSGMRSPLSKMSVQRGLRINETTWPTYRWRS